MCRVLFQRSGPAFVPTPKVAMEVPVLLDDVVPRYVLDKVFFAYYVFQIVSTLGLDIQGSFPAFLFPSWVRAIYTHHVETWRDPFLANTWHHPWYFAICMWEYTCHIPFYFVAAYAYYHGVRSSRWIRIPVIMYCTQTISAVSGVIMMALFEDFSAYADPHPTNFIERCKLAFMYSIFFFIPLLNLADAISSKHYISGQGGEEEEEPERPSSTPNAKKTK